MVGFSLRNGQWTLRKGIGKEPNSIHNIITNILYQVMKFLISTENKYILVVVGTIL